ncbi:MAG: Ig-like domain-containing protein [Lachnospiraceae bacterium]|nr:Ig-like domain-containing protein [Lachnospiraceae bacterium]MBQ4529507.1 Ig-like domain-containing protein [Lachnospiraceae bacterium]
MGRKKGTYKIRKVLFTYMLGIFLILSAMSQVVLAEEEPSESVEEVQTQEEVVENLESISIVQEEMPEESENIQIILEEIVDNEDSAMMATEEVSENEESTEITSEEPNAEELINVEELDLGDYMTEMIVGDKQLLVVTVLPMDVSEAKLSYDSSNAEVATVNGMGRITALKKGKTKITVTCEEVSQSFELTVKEVQNTEIEVKELDLGDCPKEIVIGTSQILSVGVIPADATNVEFKYESNNPNVASVNALGRLTGKTLGTAEITVSCGKVRQKFQVTVIKDETKEKVEVTDIEISDYEEELNVDSLLSLSVTVLPKDATDAEVTYKSSNDQIATVNSSGEVKGIAPGEVIISISAGKITKEAKITVKIATKGIELNSDYCVMKPNEIFQIIAQVQPADAPGEITYKSMNTKVAEVSDNGVITAKACGNAVIAVSNGDLQVSVNVIVNEEQIEHDLEEGNSNIDSEKGKSFPHEVGVNEYPIISAEMLKYFYEKEKVLTIRGEDYTIYLDGKDIVNFENELETKLLFSDENGGLGITVNAKKKLCGKITIDISNKITDEKYLYLYNEEKEKYQQIQSKDVSLLCVDTAGKYLVTNKKLSGIHINMLLILVGCVAVIIGGSVYIGGKKKYWFW